MYHGWPGRRWRPHAVDGVVHVGQKGGSGHQQTPVRENSGGQKRPTGVASVTHTLRHLPERGIYKVEREVEGCVEVSFADDCGWLVEMDLVDSVEQLYRLLARAVMRVVEWGERNHAAFHN